MLTTHEPNKKQQTDFDDNFYTDNKHDSRRSQLRSFDNEPTDIHPRSPPPPPPQVRMRKRPLRRPSDPNNANGDNKNNINEKFHRSSNNNDNETELHYVFLAIIAVSFCVVVALAVLIYVLFGDYYWWTTQPGQMITSPSTAGSDVTIKKKTKTFEILEPSSIYKIPNSLDHIGDKSDEYAILRQKWDERKLRLAWEKIRNTHDNIEDDEKELQGGNGDGKINDLNEALQLQQQLELDSLQAMYGERSSLYDSIRPMMDTFPRDAIYSDQQQQQQQLDDGQQNQYLHYDVFNCPDTPLDGYPADFPTIQLIRHWPLTQSMPNFSDTDGEESDGQSKDDKPPRAYMSLCIFDYSTDYGKIVRYRHEEVPFVVRNDPEIAATVERWRSDDYRTQLFGSDQVRHRTEEARTNQFLFWRPDKKKKKKKPQEDESISESSSMTSKIKSKRSYPTKLIQMTYSEWKQKVEHVEGIVQQHNLYRDDDSSFSSPYPILKYPTNITYYYYRLIGCGETGPKGECDKIRTSEYLYDELPFFQPKQGQLYIVDPNLQRGIHCRFGMPGIFAQTHFDASRNAIVVLGGVRRYILSHPKYCRNLNLYPPDHSSARHSKVDWSRVADTRTAAEIRKVNATYPMLDGAKSLEVVLQAGDLLYLPTNWLHMIVSLTTNYQCNTRSGRAMHYDSYMDECGFGSVNSGATRQEQKA